MGAFTQSVVHKTIEFVLLTCTLLRCATHSHYFELPAGQLKCRGCSRKRETESIERVRIEELNVAALSKNGKLSIEFSADRAIWIRPDSFELPWCVCHWWTLISSYITRRLCRDKMTALSTGWKSGETSDASARPQFEINYCSFGYCSSRRAPSLPPSPPSIDRQADSNVAQLVIGNERPLNGRRRPYVTIWTAVHICI